MRTISRFPLRFALAAPVVAAMSMISLAPATLPAQDMAEQGAPSPDVERLNRAPVSNEVLRVTLPKPTESTLENGMTLMVLEDHRVPTFSVSIELPVSSLAEPADLYGISEATASLLTRGTESMDFTQLAERLAELGGSLNASAGQTSTSITVSGLTDNMDDLLGVLREVLMKPTFPEDQLNQWKQSQLADIEDSLASAEFLGAQRLMRILYPNDNRGVLQPTPEQVNKLTRDDIVAYFQTHYGPMKGGLVGVSGDVSQSEMAATLNALMKGWKAAEPSMPEVKIEAPIKARHVVLVDRPDSVQTYLMVGNRAITRTDPDYVACQVMNYVLGGGPASRLFVNIREQKGYTYGIYSYLDARMFVNDFSTATSVRTEVTGPALEEVLKEFTDIRNRLIPADELADGKRTLTARFALSLESSSGLLNRAMSLKEYGLPADYWDKYPDMIAAVTAEKAREVARKYVPVDDAQIIAVGDADAIRDVLAKYGEVEEYTVEGERVEKEPAQ